LSGERDLDPTSSAILLHQPGCGRARYSGVTYPRCRVVRPSIALPSFRPRFCATCGTTPKFLSPARAYIVRDPCRGARLSSSPQRTCSKPCRRTAHRQGSRFAGVARALRRMMRSCRLRLEHVCRESPVNDGDYKRDTSDCSPLCFMIPCPTTKYACRCPGGILDCWHLGNETRVCADFASRWLAQRCARMRGWNPGRKVHGAGSARPDRMT
jgi:hypothetical protein